MELNMMVQLKFVEGRSQFFGDYVDQVIEFVVIVQVGDKDLGFDFVW